MPVTIAHATDTAATRTVAGDIPATVTRTTTQLAVTTITATRAAA